jgi:hypothetical protein
VRFRPPSAVRTHAGGRRVLAWTASGGSPLVATEHDLVLPEGERVPWDLVLRATWEPDTLELTAQDQAGGRPVVRRLPLDGDPGVLPEVVRERVKASIVVQHHVELVGERGARIVARRTPGTTELRWSVVFDAGLDASDPQLRRRADDALADLRVALGV